jgi:hypothetical protein
MHQMNSNDWFDKTCIVPITFNNIVESCLVQQFCLQFDLCGQVLALDKRVAMHSVSMQDLPQ